MCDVIFRREVVYDLRIVSFHAKMILRIWVHGLSNI